MVSAEILDILVCRYCKPLAVICVQGKYRLDKTLNYMLQFDMYTMCITRINKNILYRFEFTFIANAYPRGK